MGANVIAMNRWKPAQQAAHIDPWVEQVAALLQRSGMTDAAVATKVGQARGYKMSPSTVMNVRERNEMLYRARLVGLSREAAVQACEQLERDRTACFVVSPAAQS